MALKKPSAAERTVDMFSAKPATMDDRPIEAELAKEEEKAERKTHAEDADRMRDKAFDVQAWTSEKFGVPDEKGNQYRVTFKNSHYYMESVSDSRYVGLMVHERDLFNFVRPLVDAVKEKQKRDANQANR